MSDVATTDKDTNTEVAVPDNGPIEGLEDFDQSDVVMPTIKISHKDATFVDNLSNEVFPGETGIEVVILGLIKQRTLWSTEIGTDDPPMCKSYNFEQGIPDPKTPARFPWTASGFAANDYPEGGMPCADCALKEWGSHPNNGTPWCSANNTFALMLRAGDDPEALFTSPAIMTLSKTGLKPSQAYMTAFQRARTPLFTTSTLITLTPMTKGQTDYAVPSFKRGTATPEEMFEMYADSYRKIRTGLQTIPVYEEATEVQMAAPATNTTPSAAADPGDMEF